MAWAPHGSTTRRCDNPDGHQVPKLTGGVSTVTALDTGMLPPGGTEQDMLRFYHATQRGSKLKLMKRLLLYFSTYFQTAADHEYQSAESKTGDKRGTAVLLAPATLNPHCWDWLCSRLAGSTQTHSVLSD